MSRSAARRCVVAAPEADTPFPNIQVAGLGSGIGAGQGRAGLVPAIEGPHPLDRFAIVDWRMRSFEHVVIAYWIGPTEREYYAAARPGG